MKTVLVMLLSLPLFISCAERPIEAKISESPQTFCNPLNLSYRFMKGERGIREAADPVVVEYKGKYYLFASKSSGYWHTEDFQNWTHVFIPESVLPIEDYSPANFVHDGYIYYVGSTMGKGTLYRSNNPDRGEWEQVKNIGTFWDPTFYVEGDNLYMYHGCPFTVGDNYWKAATNSISIQHPFERRLSFYPAGIDADGYMFTDTYLGDYPMFLPSNGKKDSRPDWMLLSCNKPVSVYSEQYSFPKENAVDENSRTSWVASTNTDDEWISIDLLEPSFIHAIQVNFGEEGSAHQGYTEGVYQSYILSASHDGKKWYTIVDKSNKRTDTPHDYIEFEKPFKARYIRLENKGFTVSLYFSLRDLRVFGKGIGKKPAAMEDFTVQRNPDDACKATLTWDAVEGAEGYIVRYGIKEDKLYNNFRVWDKTTLDINSLNSGVSYYFTIDTYSSSGVTPGRKVVKCL